MGEILAAGDVAASPVLACKAELAAFEQVVVQWIVVIWGTPVAALMVDRRPPRPQLRGPLHMISHGLLLHMLQHVRHGEWRTGQVSLGMWWHPCGGSSARSVGRPGQRLCGSWRAFGRVTWGSFGHS